MCLNQGVFTYSHLDKLPIGIWHRRFFSGLSLWKISEENRNPGIWEPFLAGLLSDPVRILPAVPYNTQEATFGSCSHCPYRLERSAGVFSSSSCLGNAQPIQGSLTAAYSPPSPQQHKWLQNQPAISNSKYQVYPAPYTLYYL